MTDIIIIGAGCAGLTAAIYGLRSGLSTIVFEKNLYGGQISITNEVENYPAIEKISGPELSHKIYNQALAQGADIKFESVLSIHSDDIQKTIVTDKGTYHSKCIIIANGVERRKLNCPGEEEFTGKGVSYCATCDGAFFRNKTIAIVGGGNTALEDALFLSNLCKKVYVIHRRDTFRGERVLSSFVITKENIEILYNTVVNEIKGVQTVSSVIVSNSKTNEVDTLLVSAVFVAIGLVPDNKQFSNIIDIDENGYIVSDENCTTNISGVYVAGDSRTKLLRQIITAAADGAIASYQAANYINTLSVPK